MGAKFTNIQPAQVAWMDNGILSVKNLYGDVYSVDIKAPFTFKPNKANFINENVFVLFEQDGLTFVLRRDKTWTLMETGSTLLLDFGFVEDMDISAFDVEYAPIGFMRVQGVICPIALDLKSRKIAHGLLEEGKSNGYDIYFTEPVDYDVNLEADDQFYKDIAMSAAVTYKGLDPSVFIYDKTASPLKNKFTLKKRG